MAGITIRRAGGDRAREDLAGDLEKQLRTRLLGAVPLTAKSSQSPPTGAVRLLEIGQDDDSTEDLPMQAGAVYVFPHGLGRPIRGRLVALQSEHATLVDVDPLSANENFDPSKYVAFETSADCTYRILVY